MKKKLQIVLAIVLIVSISYLARLTINIYKLAQGRQEFLKIQGEFVEGEKEKLSRMVFFYGKFKAFENDSLILTGIEENLPEYRGEMKVEEVYGFKELNEDLKEGTLLKVIAIKEGNSLKYSRIIVK